MEKIAQDKAFYTGFALLVFFWAALLGACELYFRALYHPHSWMALLYVAFVTLIGHLIMKKGMNTEDFYNYTMATTGLRLFLTAAVLFTYFYLIKIQPVLICGIFFVIYFSFLGFEIKSLLSNLRANSTETPSM